MLTAPMRASKYGLPSSFSTSLNGIPTNAFAKANT
jgi:hypothetical protein